MSSSGRPGIIITKDHLGPGINLTNWICLVVMCLVVLLKVSSKLIRNHKTVKVQSLQLDDYFISAAMVRTIPILRYFWLTFQLM